MEPTAPDNEPVGDQPFGAAPPRSLGTWTRIYLHGLLAFLVLYALAYVVSRLVPLFDFLDRPGLAVLLSVLTIVVVPPAVGSVVLYGVLPLLGRRGGLRGLEVWDERLIAEVTNARQRAQVVIINWPSPEVRTMGVLTSTIKRPGEAATLATVYIPTAPQTKFGYIRVVRLDEVEHTDWTLRQWQLYQLTFGASSPPELRDQ